jgi:hypothetical protein
MAETRRRFDREFREGAVRIVRETGKPIAQVARFDRVHAAQRGEGGVAGASVWLSPAAMSSAAAVSGPTP